MELVDKVLREHLGRHDVSVHAGMPTEVRLQLEKPFVPCRLSIHSEYGPRSLSGVFIRVRAAGARPYMFGGDGLDQTRVFWVPEGELDIQVASPGYVRQTLTRSVVADPGYAVRELRIVMQAGQ